jgi:hypothetical protein
MTGKGWYNLCMGLFLGRVQRMGCFDTSKICESIFQESVVTSALNFAPYS